MKSLVLLSYKKLTQKELGTFANNVVLRTTNDPQFAALAKSVSVLKVLSANFQTALSDALNGGRVFTLKKEEAQKLLFGQLDVVAREVDVLADGDEAVVLAAGFEVRKAPVALTSIAAPTGLTATNLNRTGEAYLSWNPVPGSSIFGIEKRKKGETVWQSGDFATASSITIKNIESGTWMEFRVITKATKGITSDWSSVVEVLVS